jgi:hypothetical protein
MGYIQKIVLIVCLVLLALILLFPPYIYTNYYQDKIVVYGFLFWSASDFTDYGHRWSFLEVSYWRIISEIGVVLAVGGAFFLLFKTRQTPK